MNETAERETKSMQIFPSGRLIRIRGEWPEVEIAERGSDDFHTPTDDERRSIRAQQLAEIYLERDVLACQSSLVDDLIKADFEGFRIDDIEGLYPDPSDWTVEQCRDWIDDRMSESDYPDPNPWAGSREDLCDLLGEPFEDEDRIEAGETSFSAMTDDELKAWSDDARKRAVDGIDDESIDGIEDWREVVRDNADAAEVFEWWLVTGWLYRNLRAIGEPGIDNGQGQWWGRTCTGQGIIMDGTLQEIALKFAD